MEYTIKCSDGSDRRCHKTLEVEIAVEGLTEEQLEDIVERNGTSITREQVEDSQIELDKEELANLKESGEVYYSCYLDSVCSACGSDQDYDDDGVNITSN